MKVFQIRQNLKSGPILAGAEFVKKGQISTGAELRYSPIFLMMIINRKECKPTALRNTHIRRKVQLNPLNV